VINPRTYETVGASLGVSAEKLTEQVGKALTNVHGKLIIDPTLVNQAQRQYSTRVNKALSEWNKKWKVWADDDLATAYLQGVKHTDTELVQLQSKRKPEGTISSQTPLAGNDIPLLPSRAIPRKITKAFSGVPNHLTFYNTFRRAAYHNLEGSTLQVLRVSNDLFRDVAVQAGSQMFRESDIYTRRALSQSMLDDFAKRGIQAVTYKNGRKVSIEAYSEMVGRTMSGHSAVQASLNRYEEYGYDLVRVSSHFRCCELCARWEGKVLSQSGKSSKYPSLNTAVSAGLYHPNCVHTISPYFPGLSPKQEIHVDPAEQKLIDKHGYTEAQKIAYKAQEQQRYIERQIRDWKMKEITALDPTARTKAHQKVLDWRKTQRTHLEKNSFLPRKYEREGVAGWYDKVSAPPSYLATPSRELPTISVRSDVESLLYNPDEFARFSTEIMYEKADKFEEALLEFTEGASSYPEISTYILKNEAVRYGSVEQEAMAREFLRLIHDAPRYKGPLYRLEEMGLNRDLILKEGHEFTLGVRSFSRSKTWIDDSIVGLYDVEYEVPVILRVKNAKSINMAPYSPAYLEQAESATAGNFRILKVEEKVIQGRRATMVELEQLNVETVTKNVVSEIAKAI